MNGCRKPFSLDLVWIIVLLLLFLERNAEARRQVRRLEPASALDVSIRV
jgi:hypothetical protein